MNDDAVKVIIYLLNYIYLIIIYDTVYLALQAAQWPIHARTSPRLHMGIQACLACL